MSQAQDDLVARATDPNAELTTLHELAQNYPGLRPYIAANPRTYPDLLNWLGTLGDPAVDAALAARTQAQTNGAFTTAVQDTTAATQALPGAQPATEEMKTFAVPVSAASAPGDTAPLQSVPAEAQTQYQTQSPFQVQSAEPQYQPQPQYQAQPAQPPYQPQPQYQAQPAQPQQAWGAPADQGVFGVGEDEPEEASRPSSTWLWILAAIALVLVVALIVWFILSGDDDGDDDSNAGSKTSDKTSTAPQTPEGTSSASPSAKPSATPTPTSTPTPTPSATPTFKAPAPSNAIELSGFTTPSGNVSCTLSKNSVSCTINQHNTTGAQGSCPDATGKPLTMAVGKNGEVSISCDTGFSASGAVLSYDASAKSDSFACTSKDDGVECWSQVTGQGFKLSRDSQVTKGH